MANKSHEDRPEGGPRERDRLIISAQILCTIIRGLDVDVIDDLGRDYAYASVYLADELLDALAHKPQQDNVTGLTTLTKEHEGSNDDIPF